MNYAKQFYVFRLEENGNTVTPQQQTDYFTISLVGNNIPGAKTMLCFYGPQAAGSLPGNPAGFSCLFNTAFLSGKMQGIFRALPMFRQNANPVYFLNQRQDKRIRELFEKMLEEVNNNYTFKYELLGNYLAEIIHYALKLQSATFPGNSWPIF